MKKGLLFLIVLVSTLSSCSLIFKKVVGIRDAKVESTASINEFLEDVNSQHKYSYLIDIPKDSTEVYDNLLKTMEYNGGFFVDGTGNKYCYTGIEKCKGIQISKSFNDFEKNYEVCDSFNFDSFAEKLIPLNPAVSITELNTKYYYIVYWAKYYGKHFEEDFKWFERLAKTSDQDISVILVNTDLQEDWGLKQGSSMDMSFKISGKKSGEFELGDIPYAN